MASGATSHEARPVGTLTFLFTDIEGSTKLSTELGAVRYGELLARHREALRGAFGAHHGHEIGTEGDSFFVVFESPAEAVRAAVDGQRALAGIDWPDDAVIRVRIGIHSGEGALLETTYVGTDVSRAARISAAGHGGQTLVSSTTAALVTGALPDGVVLAPLGEHRLKDLQPEPLFQLEIDGLPSHFPPIRSLDARPNNLPTQLTTFVGRERELADATALLEGTRLLTLTGPGGTGKTRLSLQLAASVSERFPGGVFFVALEPVREAALIVPRIARVVGLAETGSRSAADVLAEWLANRRVLFVLDNLEQIPDAGGVVADLLRSAPELSIVATSRAALRVSGEQEYPVPGLPVPPDLDRLSSLERARLPMALRERDPEALGQFESVRLFVARAAAVRPDFALTAANADAVGAICARLQGMPLAIELAAARVKILAPDAILDRLEHQLQVLASGSRDLPPRQQTLRGAIAWSYDLLDPGLRRLLDRMSVFVGGASLEAVEAVCGPSDELGTDVFDGVAALVDQSLVRSDEVRDETRFRLLDTIREFAAEHLDADGDASAILARHSEMFRSLAERLAPRLSGTDQRAALDRLDLEHDNVRAVLDRAVAAGDGATAIPLAFAMWRFWQKRGHLAEARARLEAMRREPWATTDPRLHARLLEALGGVCWWQADLATMQEAYEAALALWESIGDRAEIANALYNVSFADVFQIAADSPPKLTQGRRGLERLEQAIELYRELGDEHGIANAEWAIGNFFYFREEPEEGARRFRQALEIFRRLGDRTMEAWSLHMLGTALLRLGQLDEAETTVRHALRHFRDAGDAAGFTLVLDDLSAAAVARGDLPRAARLRGAARNLSAETGATLASFVEEWFEQAIRPNARTAMTPEELRRYEAEGAAMSLDGMVEYALEGGPPGSEADADTPPVAAGSTAATG